MRSTVPLLKNMGIGSCALLSLMTTGFMVSVGLEKRWENV